MENGNNPSDGFIECLTEVDTAYNTWVKEAEHGLATLDKCWSSNTGWRRLWDFQGSELEWSLYHKTVTADKLIDDKTNLL